MSVDEDLGVLDQQEQLLQFAAFDADTAWRLGSLLRGYLLARGAGGSMEIEVAGHVLFACATPGATRGRRTGFAASGIRCVILRAAPMRSGASWSARKPRCQAGMG